MNKFGDNPSITTATDPEDVWDGGGLYAFYPTTAQAMEVVSTSVEDAGTVVSSGEATALGVTTLIDSTATFISDGVVALDLLINDTNSTFGIIISVDSETQVTISGIMTNGSQEEFVTLPNSPGDTYRIATPAGTGAATVGIYGLDENWMSQNEIVVLNGQTAVDLVKTYLRVNRMVILTADPTAGSESGLEGTLTCQIDGAGTTAAVIINGNNQTLMAIYTVPAGRTGRFLQGYVGVSKGVGATAVGAAFTWRARTFGGVFNVKGTMSLTTSGSGWWRYPYKGAPGLPERTDVIIRCEEVSATIGVVAGMDILLIDD